MCVYTKIGEKMSRGNNTFKTMEFTSGGVCKNAVSDNIVTKEFADELNDGFNISIKTMDKNKTDLPCGCNSYMLNKDDVSKSIDKKSKNKYTELSDSNIVAKELDDSMVTSKGLAEKLKSEPGMIANFAKNHPLVTAGGLALGGSDVANRLQDRRRNKMENKNIVAKELDDSMDMGEGDAGSTDTVDKCAGSSFPIVKKRP